MFSLYFPALLAGFLITLLEMTEVVALVFAVSAEHRTIHSAAYGAATGTLVVAIVAVAFGAVIVSLPEDALLLASAVVLAAFGLFLFRSTVKSYRRQASVSAGLPSGPTSTQRSIQFAGGFSIGAVETIEAVIVLLALAAAGYGLSAAIGALLGGAVLLVAAAFVHEQIRKIKVPWLKWGATSLLFSFAVFWGGEAAGVRWPGGDLILLPLFALFLVLVQVGVRLRLRATLPVETKS